LEKDRGNRGATKIKKRKLNWIGHTVRKGNEAIEREALDWNWQGKRRRGTARYRGRRSVHSEGVLLDIGGEDLSTVKGYC